LFLKNEKKFEMKVFLRYEDNADSSLHKSLKITLPKSWKNGPTSKLLGQFVSTYNASDLGVKNPLDESDLHLATSGTPEATNYLSTKNEEKIESELSPLASDSITLEVIEDREDVYIVHGPSQTLSEIKEEKRLELERKRAIQAMTVACVHFGCNKRFPKEGPYPSCNYHSGPPVFHETAKFWSCCPQKKAYDWEDFQAISGCQTGQCTHIKEEDKDDSKDFLGGCDLREAATGGAKLKSIDDFNVAQASGGSDAAPVLDRLRRVLEEVGVENELFDQVTNGLKKEYGEGEDELNVVTVELGKKLKDAMKAIAVEQLRIK